jgi:hypothetical protein
MADQKPSPPSQDYDRLLRSLYAAIIYLSTFVVLIVTGILIYTLTDFSKASTPPEVPAISKAAPHASTDEEEDTIIDGIHQPSGLIAAPGFELIQKNCLGCHSGQLIAQNRASREGWKATIRWMQATQGLWNLGDAEPAILDYLSDHYAPVEEGRRAGLDLEAIEWYILEQ